ncbi:MAG: hypothetical protein CMM26_05040 [Rhodospirillaceae bacterium]|nr:hypothetical protein [Rhodospirillaceae bacterium]
MFEIYRAVMDSDRNPLNNLPRAQRFQIMVVLSSMWTTIFCTAAGAWFWYGELLFAHVLVALGVALTGATFHSAAKRTSYRSYPKADGTARYDDVWGA